MIKPGERRNLHDQTRRKKKFARSNQAKDEICTIKPGERRNLYAEKLLREYMGKREEMFLPKIDQEKYLHRSHSSTPPHPQQDQIGRPDLSATHQYSKRYPVFPELELKTDLVIRN